MSLDTYAALSLSVKMVSGLPWIPTTEVFSWHDTVEALGDGHWASVLTNTDNSKGGRPGNCLMQWCLGKCGKCTLGGKEVGIKHPGSSDSSLKASKAG